MRRKPKAAGNATRVMRRMLNETPEDQAAIKRIKQDMAVGEQIHAARKAAGLTQAQLAERIGTTQSVISDLEDAEYEGHTLTMLRRIAEALGLTLRVAFIQNETSGRDPLEV